MVWRRPDWDGSALPLDGEAAVGLAGRRGGAGPCRMGRVGRPSSGPGHEQDLAAFLERRDPETMVDNAEPLADGADGWLDVMAYDEGFHPITRACMGYHLWRATS